MGYNVSTMIKLVILTGVSGAGKSTIGHTFEEKNYRIIENIPEAVFPNLLRVVKDNPAKYGRTVVQTTLEEARPIIELARADKEISTSVLALDCSIQELRSRFRLTRHVHPLEANGKTLEECLDHDRKLMEKIRPLADLYIDTTNLASTDLRKIAFNAIDGENQNRMTVTFASFGYKFGIPQDAEIIFDTRIVPNPFWVKGLKDYTGLDKPVIDFLEAQPESKTLLSHISDYLDFYLEKLDKEGRNYVFIDVGCSGGQHRSVYFAQKLYERYKGKYISTIVHRELPRYVRIPTK